MRLPKTQKMKTIIHGMFLVLLLAATAYGVSVDLESRCYQHAVTIPAKCKEQCKKDTMETPAICDQCIQDNIPQACQDVAPLEVPNPNTKGNENSVLP